MAPRHSTDSLTSGPDGSGSTGGSSVPLGDNSATADIVAQARNRSDGFLVGDDRAIGSPPNWASQESQQLYHGATVDNDPASAEAVGQVWGSHSTELNQAANELYNAISELGSVWIGQGAAAAQGALVGIANSGSQAAEAARTMSTRMSQQAAAAAEVKKMPAPKEFDPGAQTAAMLAGGPAAMVADMKAQSDAADAVKAAQVQYFNAYTKAMSEIDGSTPSFGPESLGLKPIAGSGASGIGGVGASGGTGAGVGGAGVGGLGSIGAGPGAGGPSGTATVPDSGQFTQAGYTPQAGPAAGATSGTAAVAPPAAAATAGAAGSGLGQSLGLGALGGAMGFAGGRALAGGSRSGSVKRSDGTQTSSDQSAANSAASLAPQSPSVVSPGGTIGGGMTPPPASGMGGAGGQAQEDEEHTHASFLIEPDPDDAFGANEATPPPVIGAWNDEEDR
jgi:hypothetical protein